MKVGICLTGSKTHRNDAMRSIPQTMARPLATVHGVEWCLLEQGHWTEAMGLAGLSDGLVDCTDWLDSARAIQGLDLVITVDTAVAHIAGGLGVPCWVLITAVPDMRWMLDRTDSPWYRSVRLYRQTIAGEWGPVLTRVAADLQQEVFARSV